MDTAENRIKEMIVNKYGSLKKFCEIIDMPWTTLDSILKRGFSNSNITNVLKISHELKVDTESLASGKIVDSIGKIDIKTETPPKIMQYFDQLNDIGKHEAEKRVEELTYIPQYTHEVKAAHNDHADEPGEFERMKNDLSTLKIPDSDT